MKRFWAADFWKKIIFRPENLLMLLTAIVISLAILYPLAIVFQISFQIQKGLLGYKYSLANYVRLVSPEMIAAIKNSFIIGLGSGLLSGVIGITLAWITSRTNVPFRETLQALNLIPFFVSPLIGAIAWSLLASPNVGFINRFLTAGFGLTQAPFNIFSMTGIIWVAGLFHTPFVYLFCIGPLSHIDPALEEASRVAGSKWWSTLSRVTIPLITPAILSALILSFVLGVEALGSPVILGLPYGIHTISTQMFAGINRYPPDYNFGASLGVLLVFVMGVAILVQRRIMGSRSFATVTGRGYRPVLMNLKVGRYIALGINLIYLFFAAFLPILILVVVSFQRSWVGYINPRQFSLQYYIHIFTANPIAIRGIKNSLFLATVGATLAIAIAIVVSYGIHRTRSWARGWLDIITTIPVGISGLVMAIGILIGFIRTPLYGTLGILLAAYVIRYFTYGQRSVSGVLVCVSTDLEESSRTCGANWFNTMRRILFPLVWPGLVGGWLLLFITYTREASMSLLLGRNGTETIAVALYNMISADSIGSVAALSVVQVAIILTGVLLFYRVTGGEGIRI